MDTKKSFEEKRKELESKITKEINEFDASKGSTLDNMANNLFPEYVKLVESLKKEN